MSIRQSVALLNTPTSQNPQHNNNNQRPIITLLKLLLIHLTLTNFCQMPGVQCQVSANACCSVRLFENDRCTQCPPGMHYFDQNCFYDLQFCKQHKNGFNCELCQDGYILQDFICMKQSFQLLIDSQKNYQFIQNPQSNKLYNKIINLPEVGINASRILFQENSQTAQLPFLFYAVNASVKNSKIIDQKPKTYFKLIFLQSNLYLQYKLIYDPLLNKLLHPPYLIRKDFSRQRSQFRVSMDNQKKDPLFENIVNRIKLIYGNNLKQLFLQFVKKVQGQLQNKFVNYTLLFLDEKRNLVTHQLYYNFNQQGQIISKKQILDEKLINSDPIISRLLIQIKQQFQPQAKTKISNLLDGTQFKEATRFYTEEAVFYNITYVHVNSTNRPISILRFKRLHSNNTNTPSRNNGNNASDQIDSRLVILKSIFYQRGKTDILYQSDIINDTDSNTSNVSNVSTNQSSQSSSQANRPSTLSASLVTSNFPSIDIEINIWNQTQQPVIKNQDQQLLKLLNIEVKIPQTVQDARPNLKQISPSIKFQQLIDPKLIAFTLLYIDIKRFIDNFYSRFRIPINSDFERVSIGQNQTQIFIQVTFKKYEGQVSQYNFVFAIKKAEKQLQLILAITIKLSMRKRIQFNRQDPSALQSLDTNTKQAISQVSKNQLYEQKSSLYELTELNYNGRVKNDTVEQIARYGLKYYNPLETKSPYQFVEFRVEVVLNNGERRNLGTITFPRQFFRNYSFAEQDIKIFNIQNIINKNFLNPNTKSNFTFLQLYNGYFRSNLFRILINQNQQNKKFLVALQIDLDNPNNPIILSKQQVLTPQLKYIMGTQRISIPISSTQSYVKDLFVPIFPLNPAYPQPLTSKQARQYLLLYFNFRPETVDSVEIRLNRNRSQSIISYGIVYRRTDGTTNYNDQQIWFFFSINRTNILRNSFRK